MPIKGFSTQSRRSREIFATLQELTGGRVGLDIVQNGFYEKPATNLTLDGKDGRKLTINGHGLIESDQVKIDYVNYTIEEIVDANTIIVTENCPASIGSEVKIMKPTVIKVGQDGSQITSQGPVQFIQDGIIVEVIEDTADPTNNKGLPVELVGASGDINITAGDINVQLSHEGSNPDSTQVGDGTNLLGINANNEAKVHDADVLSKLGDIDTKIPTDPSTVTKQSELIAKVNDVLTKNDEILTELKVKADPTENQYVDVKASVLPTGAATESKQSDTITVLNNILSDLDGKADKAEEQWVNVKASVLPTGASTETKQDDTITAIGNLLTELQNKADLSETQPVSLSTIPLASGAATEAKQDSIITEITNIKNNTNKIKVVANKFIDASSSNIPSNVNPPLEIEASTAFNIGAIQSLDTTGYFIGLYTGASGSEVLKYIIGPGSDTTINVTIAAGERISVRSMDSNTISSGQLGLNYIG